MQSGAEEVGGEGDGEQEGEDVADGLADFDAEEAQHAGQDENQGDEEDAVAGGGEDVGRHTLAGGLQRHVAHGDHGRHG